jgi:hypothetical protein
MGWFSNISYNCELRRRAAMVDQGHESNRRRTGPLLVDNQWFISATRTCQGNFQCLSENIFAIPYGRDNIVFQVD